ncbi:MAG: tyrosine-type recombinase/integrase, partial [Gammaproteobacteria bacterium]
MGPAPARDRPECAGRCALTCEKDSEISSRNSAPGAPGDNRPTRGAQRQISPYSEWGCEVFLRWRTLRNRQAVGSCRHYALLLFLYNSGARASEAAALTIADLDWYARSVRLLGKGSRSRTCPLWSATLEVLRPLSANRASTERVFLNRNRHPITRSGIHALVKRYAARARA